MKLRKKIPLVAALGLSMATPAAAQVVDPLYVQFSYASCQRIKVQHSLAYSNGAVLTNPVLISPDELVACPVTVPFGVIRNVWPKRVEVAWRYLGSNFPSATNTFRCRLEIVSTDPSAGGSTTPREIPPSQYGSQTGTLDLDVETLRASGAYTAPILSATYVNSLTLKCVVPAGNTAAIDGYSLVYQQ